MYLTVLIVTVILHKLNIDIIEKLMIYIYKLHINIYK